LLKKRKKRKKKKDYSPLSWHGKFIAKQARCSHQLNWVRELGSWFVEGTTWGWNTILKRILVQFFLKKNINY
jgi:hypothetical protein